MLRKNPYFRLCWTEKWRNCCPWKTLTIETFWGDAWWGGSEQLCFPCSMAWKERPLLHSGSTMIDVDHGMVMIFIFIWCQGISLHNRADGWFGHRSLGYWGGWSHHSQFHHLLLEVRRGTYLVAQLVAACEKQKNIFLLLFVNWVNIFSMSQFPKAAQIMKNSGKSFYVNDV